MPGAARLAAAAAQATGNQRAESRDPDPNGLVGYDDPALGQKLLNVAEAEGERKYSQIACWMTACGKRKPRYGVAFIPSGYPLASCRASWT